MFVLVAMMEKSGQVHPLHVFPFGVCFTGRDVRLGVWGVVLVVVCRCRGCCSLSVRGCVCDLLIPKKLTRVAAPSPRASLGRRTVCGRTEQRRPPVTKRYETN